MAWIRLTQILPEGKQEEVPVNTDTISRALWANSQSGRVGSIVKFTDGGEMEVKQDPVELWGTYFKSMGA